MTNSELWVTAAGTLTRIDSDDGRLLEGAEFDATIVRIADYLDDLEDVTDPGVWGQGGTGAMEITFIPDTPNRITATVRQILDAAGIVDLTSTDDTESLAAHNAASAALRDLTIESKRYSAWRLWITDVLARLSIRLSHRIRMARLAARADGLEVGMKPVDA